MSSVQNPDYDMQAWLRNCEEEVIEPLEGNLKGTFPNWIQGTLLRNGPGSMKVDSHEFKHVYDGTALLHRFAIKEGQVTYQCRFLNSNTFKKNRAANRIVVTEFGTKSVPDPCQTIFDRINVKTLETLEKKNLFGSLIVCHSAHPHVMPNGDVYNIGMMVEKGLVKNVIIKFPYTDKGNMFELAEAVKSISPRWRFNPSYIHSFGITEYYFVIIEQPMGISLWNILRNNLVNEAFVSYMTWYKDYETQILLVHRKTNSEVRYTTDAFFFMHTINCFELEGKLIIDVCAYKDAKLIDAMYTKAIKSSKNIPNFGEWMACRAKRIEIPLEAPCNTHVGLQLIADVGIEFPRINYELCNGRPYRYFYGIGFEVNSKYGGSIIKVDTRTGEVKTWYERYGSPSEPVFVARPGSKDEDDGVVLSAVVWSNDEHAVTLLVLCARDLTEVARAHFTTPSHATKCFHGWFLPDKNKNF